VKDQRPPDTASRLLNRARSHAENLRVVPATGHDLVMSTLKRRTRLDKTRALKQTESPRGAGPVGFLIRDERGSRFLRLKRLVGGQTKLQRIVPKQVVDVVGTVFGLREHLLQLALGAVIAVLQGNVNRLPDDRGEDALSV